MVGQHAHHWRATIDALVKTLNKLPMCESEPAAKYFSYRLVLRRLCKFDSISLHKRQHRSNYWL